MITAAALLALIGLTPGILALLGAPSIAGLMALSTADKITLATTVIGLIPHHRGALLKLGRLPKVSGGPGHVVAVVHGGPGGWGRSPVEFVWQSDARSGLR